MVKPRVGLKKYTPTQNLYIIVFGELPETDVVPEDISKLVEFVYRNGGHWCINSKIVMEYLGIIGDGPCPQHKFYHKGFSKQVAEGLRRPLVAQQFKAFYASRNDLQTTINEFTHRLSEMKLESAMLLARVNLAIQDGVILTLHTPKEYEFSQNPYDISAEDLGLPEDTVKWLDQYMGALRSESGFRSSEYVGGDAKMLSGMPNMYWYILDKYGHCESSLIHMKRIRKAFKRLSIDIDELSEGKWLNRPSQRRKK